MKLSRINTLLLAGIIIVNAVTLGVPFVPALLFKVAANEGKQQTLHAQLNAPDRTGELQPNRLILPTALFNGTITEGQDARALRYGVWRRPNSSIPGSSNMVLVAHRFTYNNPRGAFYNLDKIKPGDPVGVIWNNQMRRYTVREVKVVGPHETAIEAPTNHEQLTLYTCTPLTWPKNRLVVIATPEGAPHD